MDTTRPAESTPTKVLPANRTTGKVSQSLERGGIPVGFHVGFALMITRNPAIDTMATNPLADLQDLANEVRRTRSRYFDFAIGDPDEPTPEFVRRALVESATSHGDTLAVDTANALCEAIANWLERRHGVLVDPQMSIVPTSGSKEAIFHLPFAVVQRSGQRRRIIWGDPGYPIYERGAILAGGTPERVILNEANGWLLDLDRLSDALLDMVAIVWLNYPHNPTGAMATLPYLDKQLRIARQHGILLCSDECYQDIWFDSQPPSLLEACAGDFAGVLAFLSLSKRSGMTGYRSGAIVGDPDVIKQLRELRQLTGTDPGSLANAAATAAWSDDEHVYERRQIYSDKRQVIINFLKTHGLEISGSSATLYVWFRAPQADDLGYVEALLEHGIIAAPGRAFGVGGRGWIRLALVPSIDVCRTAVDAWSKAIHSGRIPS